VALMRAKVQGRKERGMAMLVALFALLLLSAIGLFMVLSSTTETRIDANYNNSVRSYYAARSGLEEVRDRMKFPSTMASPSPTPLPPGGLADLLPQDIAGNANGVLYILNPANGEVVDPTDPNSPYFDDQLCHDYNSGVAAKDVKCTVLPGTTGWNLTPQNTTAAPGQLGYKWVRINMKTNRIAAPYCVDAAGCAAGTLDTVVCWDGQSEQLLPGGTTPSCDANGMQTVYMLTSLSATPQVNGPGGSRYLVRSEVVAPSIRPAGMITMGATSSTSLPVLGGNGIPGIAIDGRAHDVNRNIIDPTVPPAPGTTPAAACSAVASLATNSSAGTQQLETALDHIRSSIVTQANNSCNADGSSTDPNHQCTYGLWWVRGTDSSPRFVTSGSSTPGGSAPPTGTTPVAGGSTSGDGPGGPGNDDNGGGSNGSSGGSNGSSGGSGHHHHHPSGAPDPTGACDPADRTCYTNLNLASPELYATAPTSTSPMPDTAIAPFTGGNGNQADTTIYQPGSVYTISNEIQAVLNLVKASTGNSNYYAVSATSMAPSYGTAASPAIVVIQDSTPTLTLSSGSTLSGYGVLVIPSSLVISGNATLQWSGIVLIKYANGQVNINSGAQGSINGALLLQPGTTLNLQATAAATSSSASPVAGLPTFSLTYSCDAIDLPFKSTPFKVISSTESSQ
jgi:hypothetical protein